MKLLKRSHDLRTKSCWLMLWLLLLAAARILQWRARTSGGWVSIRDQASGQVLSPMRPCSKPGLSSNMMALITSVCAVDPGPARGRRRRVSTSLSTRQIWTALQHDGPNHPGLWLIRAASAAARQAAEVNVLQAGLSPPCSPRRSCRCQAPHTRSRRLQPLPLVSVSVPCTASTLWRRSTVSQWLSWSVHGLWAHRGGSAGEPGAHCRSLCFPLPFLVFSTAFPRVFHCLSSCFTLPFLVFSLPFRRRTGWSVSWSRRWSSWPRPLASTWAR